MENKSIWLEEVSRKELNPLKKNVKTDILIIGGGITGISTLYQLRNSKKKVMLVEKNFLYEGVTSKTTGKLTYLQGSYHKIKKAYNEEVAKKYLDSQKNAISLCLENVKRENISCNLEKVDSYLFTEDEKEIKTIEKEKEFLEINGQKVDVVDQLPNKEPVKLAIKVSDTYVFHPLKYLSKLVDSCLDSGMEIYENTKIESIKKKDEKYICEGCDFLIEAEQVVLALHYPYFLIPYFFPLKCTLEKSYIGVLLKDNLKFSAINTKNPITSIRYYQTDNKSYEFLLTSSHNIAIKNNEKEDFSNLEEKVDGKIQYKWSNIDILTNDNIPFIGRLENNLYIGTGYNTWGMTNGILAGKILSDLVLGKENPYIELFNPKRGVSLEKIFKFPVILSSNAYSFIKSKVSKEKSWYSKNVEIRCEDGKKIGVYIDKDGIEHKVFLKCPHLGCNLVFNEVEHTWDCPCHGSRFSIDGVCIEGPSNYDITYKKD